LIKDESLFFCGLDISNEQNSSLHPSLDSTVSVHEWMNSYGKEKMSFESVALFTEVYMRSLSL